MRVGLGPDHEDIRDGRVGDPHLGTGQAVPAVDLHGPRCHAARIGAGVGLGQAETADQLTACEAGQETVLLLLRAISVDRIHDEARLDRHRRPVAAVDPLDRTRHQAVADIIKPGAAIFDRHGRSEQAEFAHLMHDLAVETFVEIGLSDARLQPFLRIGFGGVADQPFLVGQLPVEVEWVRPVERQGGRFAHYALCQGLNRP
jgi:hypothetical protein